ncbi:MAG: nucleotidyltransferase domain-containing protein [Nitrospirota bacterium]|nr:nucleotidyltransferase domain-containing protein [Nitrospirota bacterium]
MQQTSDYIYDKSLEQIKAVVLDAFSGEEVMIILFGSRARGDFDRRSDIDIGIMPRKKYDQKKLILLKEKLENMNIPYKIDIVNISKVSDVFREKVLKEGKIWRS